MTARLTPRAAQDIDDILENTLTSFGISQLRKYQSLLDQAITDIAEAPFRPSSKSREELGRHHRSWRVSLSGKRQDSSPHVIFYFCVTDNPTTDIVILRILHVHMDPHLHLD